MSERRGFRTPSLSQVNRISWYQAPWLPISNLHVQLANGFSGG
jgi:hypothetical protein